MNATLMKLWRRLRKDERGGLLSTEYIILGTLLTLGLIVGITAARNSIVTELEDYAASLRPVHPGLNQQVDHTKNPTFFGSEGGYSYSP